MEFLNLIKERYSCKKFDGRPIDESVLTAILEAGAPSQRQKCPGSARLRPFPQGPCDT